MSWGLNSERKVCHQKKDTLIASKSKKLTAVVGMNLGDEAKAALAKVNLTRLSHRVEENNVNAHMIISFKGRRSTQISRGGAR